MKLRISTIADRDFTLGQIALDKMIGLLVVYAAATLFAYLVVIPFGANGVLGFSLVKQDPDAILRMALVFFGCFFGMIAANIYGRVSSSSEEKIIDLRSSVLAAVISPIVAAVVFSNAAAIHTGVALLFVSFQNGFFWQAVVSKNV